MLYSLNSQSQFEIRNPNKVSRISPKQVFFQTPNSHRRFSNLEYGRLDVIIRKTFSTGSCIEYCLLRFGFPQFRGYGPRAFGGHCRNRSLLQEPGCDWQLPLILPVYNPQQAKKNGNGSVQAPPKKTRRCLNRQCVQNQRSKGGCREKCGFAQPS